MKGESESWWKKKRFKHRQAERLRENKVTSEAKSLCKEWSAVRITEEHHPVDCQHKTMKKGREGEISPLQ